MSYIEKEKLIKADIASIENRVRHAFNQGYDLGFKDGKEKAKPQEQEPTTKNDKVDCEHTDCNNCVNHKYCDYELTTKNDLSSGLDKNSKKLEKDFGELDCISRADAKKAIIECQYSDSFCEEHSIYHSINTGMALIALSDLPSVTPQEPVKKLEEQIKQLQNRCHALTHGQICVFCSYECEHNAESEG